MAKENVDVGFGPPLNAAIDQFICELGFGCNPADLRRACRQEMARLSAWSDGDLRLLGITRRQIPSYVLRERAHRIMR